MATQCRQWKMIGIISTPTILPNFGFVYIIDIVVWVVFWLERYGFKIRAGVFIAPGTCVGYFINKKVLTIRKIVNDQGIPMNTAIQKHLNWIRGSICLLLHIPGLTNWRRLLIFADNLCQSSKECRRRSIQISNQKNVIWIIASL